MHEDNALLPAWYVLGQDDCGATLCRHFILLCAPEAAALCTSCSAGGEEFKMLAGEMSECRSRLQGGLVGWIERGQTAPTFEQAAFEADVGELVRAETHFGLHLIKVEAER